MDQGARFYRCDFQVHTPRDCNWAGERPQDEDGRREYAVRFVAACRQKGLDAVAITDHHDLCYFPYIKAAADAEVVGSGNPLPPHRRLVVLPGMELTLAVPCQAILLFDADMEVDRLEGLYPLLGVTPVPYHQAVHAQAIRLDAINSFDALCSPLDRNGSFRGRYIILPNVTDKGHATLMRESFTTAYKTMPCVGGYLDKPVAALDVGTRKILDGEVAAWGFKQLGLFQTSDNRTGEFTDLGKHSTWVKWARPTAEALRQACLARDTRISHTQPATPDVVVTRLEVSDSKFLGQIDLHLNPQFNCLIGGRGTGKSTILEYIRWTLCDQPPDDVEEDDARSYRDKRAALIRNTLQPVAGVVTVTFRLNSVSHAVRRSSKTNELQLRIGESDYRLCSEADVRKLLPVQAYSQKQLSAVGVRAEELVRFVRTPIKSDLDRIAVEIDRTRSQAAEVFAGVVQQRRLRRDQARDELELASLAERVAALRQELKGVVDADRRVLSDHDLYLQEQQVIERVGRELANVRDMVADSRAVIADLPAPLGDRSASPNWPRVQRVQAEFEAVVVRTRAALDALAARLADTAPDMAEYSSAVGQWQGVFDDHLTNYERVKQVASSHNHQLDQIEEVEAKIKVLRTAIGQSQASLERVGDTVAEFGLARADWVGLYRQTADLMALKCRELTALSGERIRAELGRGRGTGRVSERLQSLVGGTRVRSSKVEALCQQVADSADPVDAWSRVIDEFEQLVDFTGDEPREPDPARLPLLTAAGFSAQDLRKLAPKLTPSEWFELAMTPLEDVPVFEYRQRDSQYIRFDEASAGQQATALLHVLLRQVGPPLLIDQPEDDLDNQVLRDVVRDIGEAKRSRQLVFTSHNPNIVVNGDADLVVCCDYRTAGDHSGGHVKHCGAIDIKEVRDAITVVMEGGQAAFRLRKEKYGF